MGLNKKDTYLKFKKRVENSKTKLIKIFKELKKK